MQIDRMEIRKALADYDDAIIARERAKEAEIEAAEAPVSAEQDEMMDRHRAERHAMTDRHEAERNALHAKVAAAVKAVVERYDAMPEIAQPDVDVNPLEWWTETDGRMPRCAKSGVVLLEDDEILEDQETGDQYLRAALGLPPRDAGPDA